MNWFNKNKKAKVLLVRETGIAELKQDKSIQKQAILEAKKQTEKLNDLLTENGFTLRIYLATGGKYKKGTR